jgi:GT2 family glycosyltransferase
MVLSIIIPTCYRNHLLSKCLDALLPEAQKPMGFDYEVIVTDDSQENCAQSLLANHYTWATWAKGPAQGPAANRNSGAKKAAGKWLVFLDDDCIPDAGLLLSYNSFMVKDVSPDVIEGAIYSDEHIKLLFIAPVNLTGGNLWSCNFAIKKSVFDQIGGFDENFKFPHLEDMDLHRRLAAGGYHIKFNDKAKVYHPARPVASPQKSALYNESWFYYQLKYNQKPTLVALLLFTARIRLTAVWRAPKNGASVKAVFLLLAELYYTIIYSRKWKMK